MVVGCSPISYYTIPIRNNNVHVCNFVRMEQERRMTGDDVIADRLHDLRLSKGISQTELAERIGETQSFVSKYENSQRKLSVIEFIRVVRALGVDGLEIFKEIEMRVV